MKKKLGKIRKNAGNFVGQEKLEPCSHILTELFSHDLEENWRMVELRIVVPEWMFYIWMVMYTFQIFWVVYGFIALAKQSQKGA